MFKNYKVEMSFKERLCGSVPLSKELVKPWLEARMPKKKPEDGKSIEELEKEVNESNEEVIEKTTLGFQNFDGGLFVRGGTIKAHLKDCANQVKDILKIKALRSKIANKVYIEEYRVPIFKNGKQAVTADGDFQQPVHVMTALGPRNALKIIRYIEAAHFSFTMKILEDSMTNEAGKKVKTIDVVLSIFEYGRIHGYGGERGMGEGRYYRPVILDLDPDIPSD